MPFYAMMEARYYNEPRRSIDLHIQESPRGININHIEIRKFTGGPDILFTDILSLRIFIGMFPIEIRPRVYITEAEYQALAAFCLMLYNNKKSPPSDLQEISVKCLNTLYLRRKVVHPIFVQKELDTIRDSIRSLLKGETPGSPKRLRECLGLLKDSGMLLKYTNSTDLDILSPYIEDKKPPHGKVFTLARPYMLELDRLLVIVHKNPLLLNGQDKKSFIGLIIFLLDYGSIDDTMTHHQQHTLIFKLKKVSGMGLICDLLIDHAREKYPNLLL